MSPFARQLRRRREPLDFSDYLELRRLRDAGLAGPEEERLLGALESALRIGFARAIPDLVTLADAPLPPPRGLTREELRVVFAMRADLAGVGATRRSLMGFDLPDGEGLKDWLDFLEAERKVAREARALLRALDAKVWAVMTGDRKVAKVPVAQVLAD